MTFSHYHHCIQHSKSTSRLPHIVKPSMWDVLSLEPVCGRQQRWRRRQRALCQGYTVFQKHGLYNGNNNKRCAFYIRPRSSFIQSPFHSFLTSKSHHKLLYISAFNSCGIRTHHPIQTVLPYRCKLEKSHNHEECSFRSLLKSHLSCTFNFSTSSSTRHHCLSHVLWFFCFILPFNTVASFIIIG